MATLERYNSFEELKASDPISSKKKKKASKETPGQKAFREFTELLRKNIISRAGKKK